jgi:hypothetical protein
MLVPSVTALILILDIDMHHNQLNIQGYYMLMTNGYYNWAIAAPQYASACVNFRPPSFSCT